MYTPLVLINYNDSIHSFTTSWDGISLNTVEGIKQFCKLSVDSLIDQGRCIETQLQKSHITQNDQHSNGKNMLIDHGHLTLFDFNIATLDAKPVLLKVFTAKRTVSERLLLMKPGKQSKC